MLAAGIGRTLCGCHSEPVRPSAANGPEPCEGAQGKVREESCTEFLSWGTLEARAEGREREALPYLLRHRSPRHKSGAVATRSRFSMKQ